MKNFLFALIFLFFVNPEFTAQRPDILLIIADRLYLEKHPLRGNDHNPYWQTWVFSSFNKPDHQNLIDRIMKRPAEDLYQSSADPFEMTNLAANPSHGMIKKQLLE